MTPEIRRATVADLGALAPLFHAYRAFYGRAGDEAAAERYLEGRLAAGDAVVLLARLDGNAVGFTLLYPTFSSVRLAPLWLLNDLFVAPEARRAGLGAALLRAAEEAARAAGAGGLFLRTARDNLPAQALYESLGWTRDGAFWRYDRLVKDAGS